mmetsp:Transcript_20589/g.52921  ORF Transcript_20589/g.52921 Transcript_20589/m.52921 type:complete len:220 (+) Transcript_20589:1676-2335(+)
MIDLFRARLPGERALACWLRLERTDRNPPPPVSASFCCFPSNAEGGDKKGGADEVAITGVGTTPPPFFAVLPPISSPCRCPLSPFVLPSPASFPLFLSLPFIFSFFFICFPSLSRSFFLSLPFFSSCCLPISSLLLSVLGFSLLSLTSRTALAATCDDVDETGPLFDCFCTFPAFASCFSDMYTESCLSTTSIPPFSITFADAFFLIVTPDSFNTAFVA